MPWEIWLQVTTAFNDIRNFIITFQGGIMFFPKTFPESLIELSKQESVYPTLLPAYNINIISN